METVFRSLPFSFQYKATHAFRLDADGFEIRARETVAILGPSGGGKSTLLRLMEGSLPWPTATAAPARDKVAMVYQDLRLVPQATALENTLHGAARFSTLQENEASSLLKDLGLESFEHRRVSELSGGQKQRVAIARALMSRPRLLLADEPLSHLDTETAREVFSLLKKLQARYGFALILTLHGHQLTHFAVDEQWWVENGRLHRTKPAHMNIESNFRSRVGTRFLEPALLLGFIATGLWSVSTFPSQGFNSANWANRILEFFSTAFVHSVAEFSRVSWSYLFGQVGLTLKMAFLGTMLGFLLSVPLAILSADGITTSWISKPMRFMMLVLRSLPALIWALIFVAALGLGSVSGTLSLALYSVGYLTKLLYEGIEELDRKPFEAIRGLGASRFQAIRFALLPSAKPLLLGSLVFMLEYNVRSASLLGLVGAGGIGQDLMASLEWRDFPTLTGILGLMLAAVLVFDQFSVRVRRSLRKDLGI